MEELGKEEIEKLYKLDKCDRCGDCLDEATGCKILGYDRERAIKEVTALVEGEHTPVLTDCITCQACQAFCTKGVNIWNWIAHRMDTENTWSPHAFSRDRLNLWNLFLAVHRPWLMQKGDPDKPWLGVGIAYVMLGPPGDMNMFKNNRIFKGLNIFTGTDLGAGGVARAHGGWENATDPECREYLKVVIDRMNTISGGKEIILAHDEDFGAISQAKEQGMDIPFKYRHVVEYYNEYIKDHKEDVKPLGFKVAHQNNCSVPYGPSREAWFDEFYELIGCTRVKRKYDRENRMCCMGASAFHLWAGDPERGIPSDVERGAELRKRNVDDAVANGATHMSFICPCCNNTLAEECIDAGIVPISIHDLAKMAFGDKTVR